MSETVPKSAVTVEIAGELYTIRSAASPDYVRECAAYVDHTLGEVNRQSSVVESQRALILAALSLADQLFQTRAEAEALRRHFGRLADILAATAEEAVQDGENLHHEDTKDTEEHGGAAPTA